ncbi:MAG: M28 family peptidase [Candidatus Aminicenantales bacterium]
MGFRKIRFFVFLTTVILIAGFAGAQSKGLKAISIEDMKFHMQFLASKEFQGRSAPSVEDDIAAKYIALIMAERPKRSIIFVWNTAEEKGLIGSYYFVQHCPVPVEKISANINLDMVSRNDPNSLYIIGLNKLSKEFDKSIQDMNAKYVGFKLDYKYEDPGEPNRFFFRSDQYPYIRYGIPGVWLFCGTTEDYHQETDLEERIDYQKMLKSTKLAYAALVDIGNKPALCKLDINPEITTRGKQNMKIVWQRPPQPQQKR